MYVSKIRLHNFRNYLDLRLDFCKNWNILIGENGVGKTNILEAIYYGSTTRSPRTNNLTDLINLQNKNDGFVVELEFLEDNTLQNQTIHHQYLRENNKSNKVIKLNQKNVPIMELLGKIPFVYFVPEDLNIIKNDSKFRRKLIDFILFQIDPNYKFLASQYNKILKERNILLRDIRDKKTSAEYLEEWDQMFVKYGVEIYLKRREIIENLNTKLEKNNMNIYYKSLFDSRDELEKIYLDKLLKNRAREIRYGVSLIGIHRDNLNFTLQNKNLKNFGSQGQQRFFILNLKILIAELIFEKTNEKPILIFDDVFSELDKTKIKYLIELLDEKYQVFISSVSIQECEGFFKDKKIFYLPM